MSQEILQQAPINGRRAAGQKRSPDRQVFVGGYVSTDLARRAKQLAAARNCSMNELIESLLKDAVAHPAKRGSNHDA